MLIIGITGGIGSGKTTAAMRFEALGVPVIDADDIARQLSRPGQAAYEKIVKAFGQGILDEEGNIQREALREIVFTQADKRRQLEKILHPLIRDAMLERARQQQAPYCVLVIPLLIEASQTDMVDRVLVIDTSEEMQVNRTQLRDETTRNQVELIMGTQVDRKTRLSFADDVIHNIGDLDALYDAVDRLDEKYRKLTERKPVSEVEKQNKGRTSKLESTTKTQTKTAPSWIHKHLSKQHQQDNPDCIVYEAPVIERVRTFLRLESLFDEFHFYMKGETQWDTRNAVKTLLAMQQVFQHCPNTKTEMIKEMDRLQAQFGRYLDCSDIDTGRLQEVREELSDTATELRNQAGKPGEALRRNELVSSLKQKENVPGGPLGLDLPCYGYWLNQPLEQRRSDLLDWFKEFSTLEKSMRLLLHIIRDSAESTTETAKGGFYQATLEGGGTHHMVRILLPKDSPYCAEISAGKHRMTIHFLQTTGTSRPVATKEDILFQLSCCAV